MWQYFKKLTLFYVKLAFETLKSTKQCLLRSQKNLVEGLFFRFSVNTILFLLAAKGLATCWTSEGMQAYITAATNNTKLHCSFYVF